MKNTIDLLARIFISVMFYYEAFDSFFSFHKTKHTMKVYGITWNQDFLLTAVIILLVLGATLVLIGYYSNVGAMILLLYYLPVSFIIYSFWNDPHSVRRIQLVNFMHSLAIIGALLLLIVNKPGNYSVKKLIYIMRLPR